MELTSSFGCLQEALKMLGYSPEEVEEAGGKSPTDSRVTD